MQPLPERVPSRVIVEGVSPDIDAGRLAANRTVGEADTVEADIFTGGPDMLGAALRSRRASSAEGREVPMAPLVNDRWTATFLVPQPGRYEYTVQAWVDRFASWRRDLAKKLDAAQD